MRVDLLTPCFWPEVRRGTERFVHELATDLLEDGHQPRIVTSKWGRPDRLEQDGVPVWRVTRLPDGRLRRRKFEDHLTHLPMAYPLLRAGGADVVNAFAPPDGAAAARWSKATGRPAVFSFMGVPDHAGLMWRRKRLELTLAAVEGSAATVALSKYAADAFWTWLGHEARVIAPGVDLDRFPLGTTRTEEPTVVCSAALEEDRKRVRLLVEAWPAVRRERPGARLLLNRPRDPGVARRYAGDGVELVDMDDSAELARMSGEAWAAALPSFGEAFGLVLVEALATGTPVVGSAGGAFPEIIDRPEVGRLFEGGADDLARALLETFELAEDPGTRAVCRARAAAFSARATTDRYEALYAELLAA
ncbi:glycosyltransferase family 4 protein [Conexibacter sp. SYSU D00693]|uniref:glycosyltransferase family 4 protein n=1 Tax=Conexibacter sp. SYSU D00693 TaxID=2812560 RepID=UPI00196AA2C1|nr:glycosyltransferase family 4 protein [Conexibacter sp. SYSU D00693]